MFILLHFNPIISVSASYSGLRWSFPDPWLYFFYTHWPISCVSSVQSVCWIYVFFFLFFFLSGWSAVEAFRGTKRQPPAHLRPSGNSSATLIYFLIFPYFFIYFWLIPFVYSSMSLILLPGFSIVSRSVGSYLWTVCAFRCINIHFYTSKMAILKQNQGPSEKHENCPCLIWIPDKTILFCITCIPDKPPICCDWLWTVTI